MSCSQVAKNAITVFDWKQQLFNEIPLMGHRNWILVVDKAFPSQTANGITTIDTHEDLLPVLKFTLAQIDSCTHVRPIIYTDKELNFISVDQVPDIELFRTSLARLIGKSSPQVLLHDSVFTRIDKASKLFNVLILKTNQVIPYSSVFLQLDCKYWTGEKEKQLRLTMK